ncbi:MAG: type II toxin-antitoxin system RelE/ParE family toxin [Pseudomonadota bacterium]
MRVSFHPGAIADTADILGFYRREASGAIAGRFLRELQRVAVLLGTFPELGTPTSGGFRSCPLTGFPYSVLYRAGAEECRILAVRHQRRAPGSGHARR